MNQDTRRGRVTSLVTALGLLAAAVVAAGCTPRFYDRRTVQLDTGDDEGVQVIYGELDGCLLRQQVPSEYIVRRPRYTLRVRPVSSLDSPPGLELRLQTEGTASLRFDDLAAQPEERYGENGPRYRLDVPDLGHLLRLTVLRGAEELGRERFRLSDDHCRVLSP